MTRHIGAHVSIAGGVRNAPKRASELQATALGMFTRNQRQWKTKPLTTAETAGFSDNLVESGVSPDQVLVHSSYLINVGNPDPEKRVRAVAALLEEARRVEALGLTLLNFHPGSGLGQISEDDTITLIAKAMAEVLAETSTAVLVLEATAGQGAHVGYRFQQLAQIIHEAGGSPRIGVCVDTCHIFAAGYEFGSDAEFQQLMREFRDSIGLDRLAGLHVNDSKTEFGSRHDRHESIGAGEIGIPALARFLTDPLVPDVPCILETPRPELWAAEIQLLSGIADGSVDPDAAVSPALDQE